MAYCPFANKYHYNFEYHAACVSPLNPENRNGIKNEGSRFEGADQGVIYDRCINGNKGGGYPVEKCPFNPMNPNHL